MSIIIHAYQQLRGLEFSDDSIDSDGSRIGLDMYWEAVSSRFVKIRRGTVALETVFGYAMSGPVHINP